MSTAAINPGFTRDPARHPDAGPSVRLTRRGRVLAVLILVGLVLAVLTVYGSRSAATDEPGAPVPTRTVEVGPGDTLWEIASDAAGPGEVREMMHRIRELNALPGSGLQVGEEIAVPVG